MSLEVDKSIPEVAIVIPVLNGTKYLPEAIDSVLAQTYRNFEIIVVDDGSTDGTWAIIEAYMASHPSIIRGIRKTNGGIASALNAGILAARSKYFAWLSHDDRFLPDKLEKQLALLKHNPHAVGVYTDYSYIDAVGVRVGRVYAPWYPQAEMLRHFLQSVFINGSTLVIERACLIELGLFDEGLRYSQDAMMWVHLIMRYPLAHIPEPLTEYRIHPEQTTSTTKKKAIRRDNVTWLARTVEAYTVEQIFPELHRPDVTADELVNAYCYLGEVFATRYYHLKLGIEQFWKAWLVWPNLRNPVIRKASQAVLRFVVFYLASRRRDLRFGKNVPSSQSRPVIIDLRIWTEVVKLHDLGLKD